MSRSTGFFVKNHLIFVNGSNRPSYGCPGYSCHRYGCPSCGCRGYGFVMLAVCWQFRIETLQKAEI